MDSTCMNKAEIKCNNPLAAPDTSYQSTFTCTKQKQKKPDKDKR